MKEYEKMEKLKAIYRYDYKKAVTEDIENYIMNDLNHNDWLKIASEPIEDTKLWLYETLWIEDSVTGNGSGSYWFNCYEAETALLHNGEYIDDVQSDWGTVLDFTDPESVDVSIRCYLLGDCIDMALEELGIEEDYYISDSLMEELVEYMDSEIREEIHRELAPCSNRKFVTSYLMKDDSFTEVLYELGIEEA